MSNDILFMTEEERREVVGDDMPDIRYIDKKHRQRDTVSATAQQVFDDDKYYSESHVQQLIANREKEILEHLVRWTIGLGLATGHADTIDDLLGEIKSQIKEAEQRQRTRLNPRFWTKEMSDLWHKNLPDTQAAFEAILNAGGE